MKRTAHLSACGTYRWTLTRTWDERPVLLVCMFNPSDADHEIDDPTITLVCHIASHNGFGGVVVVNMCPLRSSAPGRAFDMLDRSQVDGDLELRAILWRNLALIEKEMDAASAVLLAWGAMGHRAGDWCSATLGAVRDHCQHKPVYVIGKCANGHPKHPLARGKHKVPKNAPLLAWSDAL
ncbi:DUF1643 domain-containing protein [Variovorax sp. NFACC27]|uniref:DUF1643 domain-containing protein n=1 Tax=unclassified Variovorax TaxID=663243 RepID=UPI00089702F5|nr:hypothetical protein SAMN03159371_03657 [Variovorax sp. NFACC28]SEG77801.1 hypothetical protein SAMN03159365_03736 [Variovorax sp. NFACC29]SFC96828.1 hypothetical protein SAMN03159379_03686 [Variovorax sp. NFACC26]SFG09759.1 hypothetical protein SAMN03159447_01795 [Variovorax sp. NFACC27]